MTATGQTLLAPPEDAADDSTPYPFFVYGTLRPGQHNAGLWEGYAAARFDGECKALDYLLRHNGGFPYAIPSIHQTSVGCLIAPNPAFYGLVQSRLDSLEGVAWGHYERRVALVDTPEGYLSAWIYMIPAERHSTYDSPQLIAVPGNDWSNVQPPKGI